MKPDYNIILFECMLCFKGNYFVNISGYPNIFSIFGNIVKFFKISLQKSVYLSSSQTLQSVMNVSLFYDFPPAIPFLDQCLPVSILHFSQITLHSIQPMPPLSTRINQYLGGGEHASIPADSLIHFMCPSHFSLADFIKLLTDGPVRSETISSESIQNLNIFTC